MISLGVFGGENMEGKFGKQSVATVSLGFEGKARSGENPGVGRGDPHPRLEPPVQGNLEKISCSPAAAETF